MGGGDHDWLKAVILTIELDIRPRLLSNALVILLYTKITGYYGTPISLTIATLQFASWTGNELFLLLAYGFLWARSARHLVETTELGKLAPTRRVTGFPIAKTNRLLLASQAIAFIAAEI